MRSILALAAAALAGMATVIASLDFDADIVPFFVGLTFFAGIQAWAAHPPFVGRRRILARGIALLWLVSAFWIGVLLVMYQAACGCSMPVPPPTLYYAGLPATVYHLVGLYGGLLFVLISAFGPDRWFERRADVVLGS